MTLTHLHLEITTTTIHIHDRTHTVENLHIMRTPKTHTRIQITTDLHQMQCKQNDKQKKSCSRH